MRGVLLLALLAACGGSTEGQECESDLDCDGLVCARNSECVAPENAWPVRVSWTLDGQPPSAYACASYPAMYLVFYATEVGDSFGFSPVPCIAGVFTVDKMPKRFVSVELGSNERVVQEQVIDSQGMAAFDLP
jgi:hypothetical protein